MQKIQTLDQKISEYGGLTAAVGISLYRVLEQQKSRRN